MRPAGEISSALLKAVAQLATAERGATLREIAAHAGVALGAARNTIKNMKRYERLDVVGQRKVPGRNRPALEYALPGQREAANDAVLSLSAVMRVWG